MSFLIKANKLQQIANLCRGISSTAVTKNWYDDYKPGPYPKTKEERDAAAKKYNLLPEEYEPYPDNGMGYGDYPKLPDVIIGPKDPYYPWTSPEGTEQRNYGEPLHPLDFGYDIYPPYSYAKTLGIFFGIMGSLFGLYYLLEPYKIVKPIMEKQYPAPGVKHYTFEQK